MERVMNNRLFQSENEEGNRENNREPARVKKEFINFNIIFNSNGSLKIHCHYNLENYLILFSSLCYIYVTKSR